MATKTLTAPQYILLYITEPMEGIGKKNWYCQSIHDTEEEAIGALLSMPDSIYTHVKIVRASLPVLTLPGDFETIIGETTHGEQ